MNDTPFFYYNPEPSPVESVDWSKATAVVINGVSYPVEHVETKRDEIRFRVPGSDEVVEVVS